MTYGVNPPRVEADLVILKSYSIPISHGGVFNGFLAILGVWECRIWDRKGPMIELKNTCLTICSCRSILLKLLMMFIIQPSRSCFLTFMPMFQGNTVRAHPLIHEYFLEVLEGWSCYLRTCIWIHWARGGRFVWRLRWVDACKQDGVWVTDYLAIGMLFGIQYSLSTGCAEGIFECWIRMLLQPFWIETNQPIVKLS